MHFWIKLGEEGKESMSGWVTIGIMSQVPRAHPHGFLTDHVFDLLNVPVTHKEESSGQ
jgi:hypothetical protein